MNTHSRYADGRTTLLALEAVFAGASREVAQKIYDSLTTDEAVRLLKETGLLEPVMAAVCEKSSLYGSADPRPGPDGSRRLFQCLWRPGTVVTGQGISCIAYKGGTTMIHFVGAGPGAVDLITVRGQKLLETADQIIYAGSLVNPQLLACAKKDCRILDSAGMTLEAVIAAMEEGEGQGWMTVRLHTGDPSVYGAIREQMDILSQKGLAL